MPLTVRSLPLTRSEFETVAENLKNSKFWTRRDKGYGWLRLHRPVLTELPEYNVTPGFAIGATQTRTSPSACEIDDFWSFAQKFPSRSTGVALQISIMLDGREPQLGSDIDLHITGGYGRFGSELSFSFDECSPLVGIHFDWEEIVGQVLDNAAVLAAEDIKAPANVTDRGPVRVEWFNEFHDEKIAELTEKDCVVMVNHSDVIIPWFWNLDDATMHASLKRAIELPAPARVVGSQVQLGFPNYGRYLAEKDKAQILGNYPWEISVKGTSKISFDDLPALLARTDPFSVQPLNYQIPRIGEGWMDLNFDGNRYELEFFADYRDTRQVALLQELVRDLYPERDIIAATGL